MASRLPDRVRELPPRRAVVTVCRSGVEVVNLSGGMRAWAGAGLPVVVGSGRSGRIV